MRTSGYSYTNLGRLFLRLFIGIMLVQFAIRQITNFDATAADMLTLFGAAPEGMLAFIICLEIICSVFIMTGFLTRLMTIPPFLLMAILEIALFHYGAGQADALLTPWQQQTYLPVMFLGVYFFLLLVGPGKISVDYFLSLHFIHTADKSEAELEEV